jgi:phosphoribosylanthranilate isomerase
MIRVKICGITRAEDARLAADLGAWAVGFIFWPGSPRYVEPGRARDIVRQLSPLVSAVGVFVDQPAAHVDAVAREVGLSAVQLHGSESPEFARGLAARVIKALPLDDGGEPALAGWDDTLVLLDARDRVRHGGTGRTIDWAAAARVARRRPILLAGGLTPDNVKEAAQCVRPAGLDVSSGVESAPGIKDEGRLRALFAALSPEHRADEAVRASAQSPSAGR